MSNTGTITEKPIQSVGFQSTKRDEEFSNDLATQAHFSGLKDALMEVVKADSQVVQRPKRQSGKNSMITTFKIMKIVMKTLRETSDCQKEMNKIIKQEWKNVAHKQSDNSKEAKDNIESSGKYQYFSLVGSQLKLVLQTPGVIPAITRVLSGAAYVGVPKAQYAFDQIITESGRADFLCWAGNSQREIGSFISQIGKQHADMQQYNVGIKDTIFNQEVQTHTSEYQNGSQQENSDKQAVDNAADVAKQLIRVQGEILMGKQA